ncbi:BsuPI-related putative proteinase inhibitor [Heyndrickxia sp. MSNUG]|uniref:BsuPI-related putative proteinase inhibitor n=1 Tax=Heyndrickxia sp. MSNUG TaxID=3136677 RepID=UPI003C2AE5E6
MRKISLLIMLLLIAVAPALAIGEEKQTVNQSDFNFFIDPVAGPEMAEFELYLRNDGNEPISFEFPTSQKYEITVVNENKKKVYQYSDGKAFAQAFETLTLQPQQSIKWRETWDYTTEGTRVKEGDYTVAAKLKAVSLDGRPISVQRMLTDTKKMYVPGENPVFKGVQAEGSKGDYKITGEARPTSGKFYYTVEDGHNELISEAEIVPGSKYPQWKPFEIGVSISMEKLPQNGSVILNLYERSKDGKIIHAYPVLLERFNNNK